MATRGAADKTGTIGDSYAGTLKGTENNFNRQTGGDMSKVAGRGHRRPHPSPAAADAGEGAVQALDTLKKGVMGKVPVRHTLIYWLAAVAGQWPIARRTKALALVAPLIKETGFLVVGVGRSSQEAGWETRFLRKSCETCRFFLTNVFVYGMGLSSRSPCWGVSNRGCLAGRTDICGQRPKSARFVAALTFV
ncbi:MAG: hypothetical protein MUC60_16485 [Oscillatoria sp. Prado101]|jgi:hypothetical protein|nr:hypothetical protein [Oscillatoria sp. Prado101]